MIDVACSMVTVAVVVDDAATVVVVVYANSIM